MTNVAEVLTAINGLEDSLKKTGKPADPFDSGSWATILRALKFAKFRDGELNTMVVNNG